MRGWCHGSWCFRVVTYLENRGLFLVCRRVRASAGAESLGEVLARPLPLAFAPISALCPRVPALERVSAVAGMLGRDAVDKAKG